MSAAVSTFADKRNQQINLLYVRHDFNDCLKLIEEVLGGSPQPYGLQCEFCLFTKALVFRQQGKLHESLQLFQDATALNPHNVRNLKQLGKALHLLGKHKAAIDVLEEAAKVTKEDWDMCHTKGLCYNALRNFDRAVQCFKIANSLQQHDSTYLQLGKLYTAQDDVQSAINTYMLALEFNPENSEVMTALGLLFMQQNNNMQAFNYLQSSLNVDPTNVRTILAIGSVIQDHSDMDVALLKYRIAAVHTPHSPQLWNNIGMCFFSKQRYIAAVACLKRALYLGPFEWIVNYNLGLVHLHTGQFASAFQFLSTAINLKTDYARSYMYLGIALTRMDDHDNACAAYEKAIELGDDFIFHLNYAISLLNHGNKDKAIEQYVMFKDLFDGLGEDAKNADPEVAEQKRALALTLGL